MARAKWYLTKRGRAEFNARADEEAAIWAAFELKIQDAWTWYDDNPRDRVERDAFRTLFWSCLNAQEVINAIVEENTALLERGISVPGVEADSWRTLRTAAATAPLVLESMERAYQKQRQAELDEIIDEAERYVSDVRQGKIKPLTVDDLMPG